MNALGMPLPSFEQLEQEQQSLVRTINLPLDTKFMYQLTRKGKADEFYRVEVQTNEKDVTFEHDATGRTNKLIRSTKQETGYYITHLKYSKKSKQIETVRQHATQKVVPYKNGSMFAYTRPTLFNGENGKVFWFT